MVNHLGMRAGDKNTSTGASEAYQFCLHPLRLLKMVKKALV